MYKVSELAKRAGVSADTVRFYTRQQLLNPQRHPDNDYQLYQDEDLQRLRFAKQARQLGFSLKDISAILTEADAKHSPCPLVREMFEHKLTALDQQIAELTALRRRMQAATELWRGMPDGVPDGHSICQLIESWDSDGVSDESDATPESPRGHCHG